MVMQNKSWLNTKVIFGELLSPMVCSISLGLTWFIVTLTNKASKPGKEDRKHYVIAVTLS